MVKTESVSWPAPPAGKREDSGRVFDFSRRERWRQRGQTFQHEVCVVWMILKDPRTPWYARVVAACTVGYLFSPVQLIPSFIPVIGLLDDFAVLWAGYKLIRRLAPVPVMRDCSMQAARTPALSVREMRPVARLAAVVILAVWLMIALAGTRWLFW
jgi:uncharacterized membrane protein YkvA (DUF1232 family)